MDFYELDLCDDVLDALDAMRFETCTPIQEKAIPPILEGNDLIGVAQTGTGKTAAFLLPVLDRIASKPPKSPDSIRCLIMSPTRELAQQIDQQLQGFSYFLPVSGLAVYGGGDGNLFQQQRHALKNGVDIVISTPGRLIAHLQMGYVDLSKIEYFILDEADRMLDMGFSDDIMQIVKHLPKERQTIMFSATMPPKIKALANTILKDPVSVTIAISRPADKICQHVAYCYDAQKIPFLEHFLAERPGYDKVLIFASSKLKVKELAKSLRKIHMNVGEMHSDLDQAQRDDVMHNFRNGHIGILVATDIVARGIDIDDIQLVVNYDAPREGEDYVHRIGRTARADNDGEALTLVNEKDMLRFKRIERLIGKKIDVTDLPDSLGERLLPENVDYKDNKGGGKGRKWRKRGNRHLRSKTKDGKVLTTKVNILQDNKKGETTTEINSKEQNNHKRKTQHRKQGNKRYNKNKGQDNKIKSTSTVNE